MLSVSVEEVVVPGTLLGSCDQYEPGEGINLYNTD